MKDETNTDVRNPVERIVSCDLQVEIICDFIKAYEKEKFKVMFKGGSLLSPSIFMLDYCAAIRGKSN